MNANVLKQILMGSRSLTWSSQPYTDDKWLIIMPLPCGNHHLGLDINGRWVTEKSESGLTTVQDQDYFYDVLMSVINKPLVEFICELKKYIQKSQLPEVVIYEFPFDELICFAARTGDGGYWTQLASSWLEQGYPISYETLVHLIKLMGTSTLLLI